MLTIKLSISEETYAWLLVNNRRLEGSIALNSDNSAEFRAYFRHRKPGVRVRLPHGSLRVGQEQVRLSLKVDLDGIPPRSLTQAGDIIVDEAYISSSVLGGMENGNSIFKS